MTPKPPIPVPRLRRRLSLIALARTAEQSTRYCLSFTAASLRPELASVVAQVHLEQGDWGKTKVAVLERNALQARSASTAKRLESELRQRLQTLSPSQLELLARGSSDERNAMAWLAVLKRIEIALDLTREVLAMKLSSLDPVLRRSDMAGFYEACERAHPEVAALSPSSQQKIRSTLLHMLRDAGMLAGKAGKGGTLGTVQRPLLSPKAHGLVKEEDPALLGGFLLSPAPSRKARVSVARSTAKINASPTAKPAAKRVGRPQRTTA